MLPSVLVNDTPSDDDPPEHTTNPFVERVVPLDAWNAEGVRRFGHDRKQWVFVCPSCGERLPVALYEQHNGTGGVGVACIGQFIPEEDLPEDKYCTYGVGSGKVIVHPVRVVFPDGEVHPFFDFADGSWPLPFSPLPPTRPDGNHHDPEEARHEEARGEASREGEGRQAAGAEDHLPHRPAASRGEAGEGRLAGGARHASRDAAADRVRVGASLQRDAGDGGEGREGARHRSADDLHERGGEVVSRIIVAVERGPVRILVDTDDYDKARALAEAAYREAYNDPAARLRLMPEPCNPDPESESTDDILYTDAVAFDDWVQDDRRGEPGAVCRFRTRVRLHLTVEAGQHVARRYIDTYYAVLVRGSHGQPLRRIYREEASLAAAGGPTTGDPLWWSGGERYAPWVPTEEPTAPFAVGTVTAAIVKACMAASLVPEVTMGEERPLDTARVTFGDRAGDRSVVVDVTAPGVVTATFPGVVTATFLEGGTVATHTWGTDAVPNLGPTAAERITEEILLPWTFSAMPATVLARLLAA